MVLVLTYKPMLQIRRKAVEYNRFISVLIALIERTYFSQMLRKHKFALY